MIMITEKEAKTKWCPLFRRAGSNGNADADGGRRTTCIGSACMAWRTERLAGNVFSLPEDQADLVLARFPGVYEATKDRCPVPNWKQLTQLQDLGVCGAFNLASPEK